MKTCTPYTVLLSLQLWESLYKAETILTLLMTSILQVQTT